MADHSLEILGQKISYPETWQGVSAVVAVCLTVVFIAYILDENRINAISKALAENKKQVISAGNKKIANAEELINNQAKEINDLTLAVEKLKKQIPEEKKIDFSFLSDLNKNRSKTTTSIDNFFRTDQEFKEKVKSLKELCPDCVEVDPTQNANQFNDSDLKKRLEEIKNNPLNFETMK